MAQKLLALIDKFRRPEDAVIEARFCALGQMPEKRRRRTLRPVSPFRFVARVA